jgi:hypothetical protein
MSRIVALALLSGALAMADATIEITPQDWRPAGAVAFDITNSSEEAAAFSFEVSDAAGAHTAGRAALPLGPHETASFALALNSPAPTEKGICGEPLLPGPACTRITCAAWSVIRCSSAATFSNTPMSR